MTDISASPESLAATAPPSPAAGRRAITFLNLAHAVDHFVLLIFPAVVIGLEAVFKRPYDEMIALSTGAFVAFGVFSIPAGWLADRWSRRNMMALFYFGCAASLAGAGLSPSPLWLAAAMSFIGVFAAIYHPVGMALLIEVSKARPRTLAFNGVCGNLGVTLAAGVSATLAAWLGWRAAFLAPAAVCLAAGIAFLALVPDDRHRHREGKRSSTASVVLPPRAAIVLFGSYMVISLTGGLTFNTALIALPKLLDERMGDGASLMAVGWLATGIFLSGGLAQLAVGRLLERTQPHLLFAAIATVQFVAIAWAGYTTGIALVAALAAAIAAIYGQTTVGDIVIARYVADAWRGRVYAVRYFLAFISSAIAVQLIAWLHSSAGFDFVLFGVVFHSSGGFDLVLGAIAFAAFLMLLGVYVMAAAVNGAEAAPRAVQPQPAE
jgi:predicted MFS family arabinose efflux permease